MPKDLDETYARILLGIDDSYRQLAFTALQWLAFSDRSLRIEELAEAAIIDPQAEVPFDLEDRFYDPYAILSILSGLVTASPEQNEYGENGVVVKLAHFSVKEFLVSERIQAGPASEYSIREIQAHTTIAEICLCYLLQFDTVDSLTSLENLDGFPLLEYAATCWFQHAQVIEENCKKSLPLCEKLLGSSKESFLAWVFLFDLIAQSSGFFDKFLFERNTWQNFVREKLDRYQNKDYYPLIYALAAGLPISVKSLLDKGADIDTQWFFGETSLQLATDSRLEMIVKLLLGNGADVNAGGGVRETALQRAAETEDETIVRLLIDNGADVKTQSGSHTSTLGCAASSHNETIMRMLLEPGADVNVQPKEPSFPTFYFAAMDGSEEILRLLLKHEANVNGDEKGFSSHALEIAVMTGREAIAQLLLDHGAVFPENSVAREKWLRLNRTS